MRDAHRAEAQRDPARAQGFAAARRAANAAMVAVASADFAVSAAEGWSMARVRLPAFWLDRFEVTAGAYAVCVEAGSCQPPEVTGAGCNFGRPARREHPINCVSAAEAARFCHWREARLPTELEWDWAARGSDRRSYAWGNDNPGGRAQWSGDCGGSGCRGGTAAVGTHPMDRSPFDILDMTGNVREWVSEPIDREGFVLRGGAWAIDQAQYLCCTARNSTLTPESTEGFRCARSP